MENKVILILVDGMRPDGILKAKTPVIHDLMKKGCYTLTAKTTFPSVTLPCHASLFFSVNAERHGITTNTWMPQVRPINSIIDTIKQAGGKTAMFYNWEQLRDLSRPGNLDFAYFRANNLVLEGDNIITEEAIKYISSEQPDFVFVYLGHTDEAGHGYGFMTDEYINAISNADECIGEILDVISEEYSVIVTADHGGHDRGHGTEMEEDMTIPVICYGKQFEQEKILENISIKDIAPTVTNILGLPSPREWEGKSII